jgi:hypothetical protein
MKARVAGVVLWKKGTKEHEFFGRENTEGWNRQGRQRVEGGQLFESPDGHFPV